MTNHNKTTEAHVLMNFKRTIAPLKGLPRTDAIEAQAKAIIQAHTVKLVHFGLSAPEARDLLKQVYLEIEGS